MYYQQTYPPFTSLPNPFFQKDQNVIKVSGEGTISVTPDRSIITLGAITENQNLQVAQSDNSRTVSAIINALMNLGIPKENIKTIEYRIDMQYDYQEGKQIFRGYKVTHMLQVTNDSIELTGRVVDTAVNEGANTITNIRFAVAEPEVYYNQALSLAIKDGQQKAATIADTLGVTLNYFPFQVQEVTPPSEPIPYQASLYTKMAETQIHPGELNILAKVRADYYYL